MTATQEKDNRDPKIDRTEQKIDRTAPAGSKNSLGEESIRDGRPTTDDSVVEAIDEEDSEVRPEPGHATGS